jgi:hypothetical protein
MAVHGIGETLTGELTSWGDGYLAVQRSLEMTMTRVRLDATANSGRGALVLTFRDGSELSLYDSAEYCCETRYMTTDDDLDYFVGAQFCGAEIHNGPNLKEEEDEEESYSNEHDTQFLHVETTKGIFVMQTHNIHNGYYGGFRLDAHRTMPIF